MCTSGSNWSPPSPYPYHLPPHFSPYNSSYGYYQDSQPFGPFPPNAPLVSPISPPYSWSAPSFSPRLQEPEQRPYIVKLLNNRIRKCRGCGAVFSRKVDGSPPDPPHNLVIAHEERRPFSDAHNVTRMSRPQNVYYHPNVSCIRRQNPSFVTTEIQVSADLMLLPLYEKYLGDHFGWCSTTS